MNANDFTYLLDNPNAVSEQQALMLDKIVTEFPYFQSARALQLKVLHNQNSFRYNQTLKVTAAHTTDRNVLFEFITVFIHPYLEKVTNHTPIYILLISVGVALLLAPLDHRLTDWVKVKLAKKRRKSQSRKASSTQKHTIT